jgi:hypothetical protein
MATENTVVLGVGGDFGNPNGTGMSKLVLSRVRPGVNMSLVDLATSAGVFHAGLKTAGLTATNLGDISLTSKSPGISAKPDDDVNVDRILVVRWRKSTETSIHTFTLPGVPASGVNLENADGGERLTDAGKLVLAGLVETFYALTEGECVVLEGVVIQKR